MRVLWVISVTLAVICFSQSAQSGPINAEMADIKEFPYMAAVLDDDMDEFLGLAVIVSKNVIFSEEITVPVEELRVRVGSSKWNSGGKVVKAKEIVDYHYYDLIILAEDLEFTDSIQPIEFSTDPKEVLPDMPMKIVGWGSTSKKQLKLNEDLMVISSAVLSDEICQRDYADIFDEVPDSIPIFCVTHPPGPGVFDETESVSVTGSTLHGFGVYRDTEAENLDKPALFAHVSVFHKKVRKTIRTYA